MKKITLPFLLIIATLSFGQSTDNGSQSPKVYTAVGRMPEFPEGEEAFLKFLKSTIVYPDSARIYGVDGRVVVGCVVNENGSLTDISIKKGVSWDLDSEALRVVRLLPKFTPGREKGKKVKVALELPIMFKFAPVESHTTIIAATDSTQANQVVEQMPEFPGGNEVMLMFIQKNIRYPSYEFSKNIQGRVVVGFTVNKDGSIDNVLIKQGVSQGIDEEAIRVVKLFPKFRPGKQNGNVVPVVYNLPIMFKLTPTSSTIK